MGVCLCIWVSRFLRLMLCRNSHSRLLHNIVQFTLLLSIPGTASFGSTPRGGWSSLSCDTQETRTIRRDRKMFFSGERNTEIHPFVENRKVQRSEMMDRMSVKYRDLCTWIRKHKTEEEEQGPKKA